MCLYLSPSVRLSLPLKRHNLPSRMLRSFVSFSHLSLFRSHKGSGSYVHFCPRPCLSAIRWAMLATHRHIGPHSVCIPRARTPTLAVQPHMCHRQREAVSSGSHMQQDMGISLAPPHLGAPFNCLTPCTLENHDPKNWRCFPVTHRCQLCVFQSVFSAPPGATCKVSGN